jgi:D-glycero-D-manno-heptose 1,7-bisphosphate phosphatase
MKKSVQIGAVFLDRDGVITRRRNGFVTRSSELQLLPRAAEAIHELNAARIKVFVVTNQRGISLGLMSEADLDRIHRYMQELLGRAGAHVDAIYYCPHDASCCVCRKPQIGMFLQAFADFTEISPHMSVMIGDSLTDMQAGRRAGARTILISPARRSDKNEYADAVADSLHEAISLLALRGTDPTTWCKGQR